MYSQGLGVLREAGNEVDVPASDFVVILVGTLAESWRTPLRALAAQHQHQQQLDGYREAQHLPPPAPALPLASPEGKRGGTGAAPPGEAARERRYLCWTPPPPPCAGTGEVSADPARPLLRAGSLSSALLAPAPAITPRPSLPAAPRPARTCPPCSAAPLPRGPQGPSPGSAPAPAPTGPAPQRRARPRRPGPPSPGGSAAPRAPVRSRRVPAPPRGAGATCRGRPGLRGASGLRAEPGRAAPGRAEPGRAAPRAAGRELREVRSWAAEPAEPFSKAAAWRLSPNISSSVFAEGRREGAV